ncbi:MAG: hypothetical protein CSA22_09555 [Deltaproteobacteria bacterium]|nr:MAG: hypothetical protein CSA22_09555 [Deltaproteobacteria bacterium]
MPDTDFYPYELRLVDTACGAGYFACCPANDPSEADLMARLETCPMDSFLHQALLRRVVSMETDHILHYFNRGGSAVRSVCAEALLASSRRDTLPALSDPDMLAELADCSPLIHLRAESLPDREVHREWIRFIAPNLLNHRFTPASKAPPVPEPILRQADTTRCFTLTDLPALPDTVPESILSPEDGAREALFRLEKTGRLCGTEMRHEASLSPIALVRDWQLSLRTSMGRHHFSVTGTQRSYGKGLSLDQARITTVMEVVERLSAFASFERGKATGYTASHQLIRASCADLIASGAAVLDPNQIPLEVPYTGTALHWVKGTAAVGGQTIHVPAQMVFLFCNLDEPDLFSGLSSTGLAAGWIPEQAKLAALLEVIERDADAVTPFHPAACFKLASDDPEVGPFLTDYRNRGIDLFFQDCTTEFGIPCFKCFVMGADGVVAKGAGAHLNSRNALISALTETPYPYPGGPCSIPAPPVIPYRRMASFPDAGTGSYAGDLAVIEQVLIQNNRTPVYVDLTRQDLDIPVFKAIVPGLELMADFDTFTRISPRLYRNYRSLFQGT